jgi:hypothetical protein
MGDDLSGFGDVGQESPTDGEDRSAVDVASSPDLHRARLSHDVQQSYGDQGKFGSSPSRASPYAYTISDHSFRSNGSHDPRYGSGSERVPPSSLVPPTDLRYQYNMPMQIRSHSHSMSAPTYDTTGHESWDITTGRSAPYITGGQPRSHTSHPSQKSHSYSSPSTHSSWQHPQGGSSTSPTSSSYLLPTLNSPFHPSSSHLHDSLSNSMPNTTSDSMSPPLYNSGHIQPTSMKQEYDSRGYLVSSSSPTSPFPSSSGRGTPIFPQRQSGLTRGLQVPVYPPSLPPQSSSSPSGIPQGYWRE